MKMVTKTFIKFADSSWPDIDWIVNQNLRKGARFSARPKECSFGFEGVWKASCLTPAALTRAWLNDEEIAFSVTLPAKYWK